MNIHRNLSFLAIKYQIKKLKLMTLKLGPEASVLCGKAVLTLNRLLSLELLDTKFDCEFFEVMSSSSSASQVYVSRSEFASLNLNLKSFNFYIWHIWISFHVYMRLPQQHYFLLSTFSLWKWTYISSSD